MRILIADDHPLFRDALHHRLERLFGDVLLFEAGTLDELMRLLSQTERYNLVLLDFWMPGLGSAAAIRDVISAARDAPVAVVSGGAGANEIVNAVQHGLRGFLPKTMPPEQMDAALSMLVAGGSYLPRELLTLDGSAHGSDHPTGPDPGLAAGLTPREEEVLRHLTMGLSNKEIARELGLADVTIKLHVRQILRKINARNRSEAAVMATRAGIT